MAETDVYGALRMPQAALAAGEVAGDPGLGVVADYLKAFLNSRPNVAWQTVAPGQPVVRTALTHDPEELAFNEKDLPALYLHRTRGVAEWMAEDYRVMRDEIKAVWVFPPVPQAHQRLRGRISSAVAKAIDAALERCRFPGWVHSADLADIDGIRLSAATSTSAANYVDVDLDGAVGSAALKSPRFITATASVASGAYALADILVEGVDEDGEYVSDLLTPLSANGGWTLTGTIPISQVTRIAVPAQALTTGALSFGHTEDEQALLEGSLVALHAGLMSLRMAAPGWAESTLQIRIRGVGTTIETRPYETVEVTLAAEERWTIEDEEAIEPLEGVDVDITRAEDGSLIEQAIYE